MTNWLGILALLGTILVASDAKSQGRTTSALQCQGGTSSATVLTHNCSHGKGLGYRTICRVNEYQGFQCILKKNSINKLCLDRHIIRSEPGYVFNDADNECTKQKEGQFPSHDDCTKDCVVTSKSSNCTCKKLGVLACPDINTTLEYNIDLLPITAWNTFKSICKEKDPPVSKFEELMQKCKTSCSLENQQKLLKMLEEVTSAAVSEGGSFDELVQQVDYVKDAVEVLKDDKSLGLSHVQDFTSSVLRSSNNIISALTINIRKRSNLTQQLVGHLEGTTPTIVNTMQGEGISGEGFTFYSQNIDMVVSSPNASTDSVDLQVKDTQGKRPIKLNLQGLKQGRSASNCSSECSTGVSVILLKNVSQVSSLDVISEHFQSKRKNVPEVRLASSVLAVMVLRNGRNIKKINGTFELPNEKANADDIPKCVFWDKNAESPNQGAWSTSGMRVLDRMPNKTSCQTNHLTSFAILLQVVHVKISPADAVALELITYIGSALGLFCLLVSIVIFVLVFRSLTSLRHRIHLNICVVLAIAHVIFLAGIGVTHNKSACTLVAVLLHYFYTAAFSWMCVEGVHLYFMVVHVYNTQGLKLRYYMLFGWGVPAIIVAISMAADFKGYGTEYACWVSIDTGLIWAFVAPVIVFTMINIVILVRVLLILLSLHESPLSPDEGKRARKAIRGVVALTPLLGLSWVFGLLCINTSTIAFQYLFAILNTLQGAFLFGFHCIGSSQVRSSLTRQLEIWNFRLQARSSSRGSGRTTRGLETHAAVKTTDAIL